MKSFEKEKDAERKRGITRREFIAGTGALGASMCLCGQHARADAFYSDSPSNYEKRWHFTLEDMQREYEKEYNGPKILRNAFQKINGTWHGTIEGQRFDVPDTFIKKTVSHLQALFDGQHIRFLFRLDTNHGHFFVPEERGARYDALSTLEEAQNLVHDETLGILFHTAEHLQENDNDSETAKLLRWRNFIGRYDERPLEVMPLPHYPGLKTTAVHTPERQLRPYPKFAAHKDGALSVVVGGQDIRFDISFDHQDYF